MTNEDIKRMARKVWGEDAILPFTEIEHFAALVAAAEREECAKVCDELVELNRVDETESMWPWEECAAAIRNRSGT